MYHSGAPALDFLGCLKYIGGSDCKWIIENTSNTSNINVACTHTVYFYICLFSFPCCSLPLTPQNSQQTILYLCFKPPSANPEVFAFVYLEEWLGVVIRKHLHNSLLLVIVATEVIS